jgi:hypothetical protein
MLKVWIVSHAGLTVLAPHPQAADAGGVGREEPPFLVPETIV